MACIAEAEATWTPGDELARVLDQFCGDIVQAVQALKECKPEPTPGLLASLQALLASLNDCARYSSAAPNGPLTFPFTRAERQVRDVVGFLYPEVGLPPSLSSSSSSSHKPIRADLSKRDVEIQTFTVGPYQVPRLFNGLWQLSSSAWGSGSAEGQEAALTQLVESGLIAADMADHYV